MPSPCNAEENVIAQWRAYLAGLLLAAIWLLSHAWQGLWSGVSLYALQALSHLQRAAYGQDFFLVFGSQDSYSLFSPIYAALIAVVGLHAATLVLLLCAYMLWTGSAAWLMRSLLQGFPFWLALIFVFAMPRAYGGYDDLWCYAESILSPRLWAEGLTLASLALMLRGYRLASVVMMMVAFVMHPLMALAGAGFLVIYEAQARPKATLGLATGGLILLFCLANFNVTPFNRLLFTMDKPWFELVLARSPYVVWDGWKWGDWLNRTLLSFSLLATAAFTAQGQQRRAFLAALALGFLALFMTWAGTSLFHNVLMIQLQVWRSLWLVQLVSYVAAAWLAGQFWPQGPRYQILLVGYLLASMLQSTVGGVMALLISALFIWQTNQKCDDRPISKTLLRLLWLIPLLTLTLWMTGSWMTATEALASKTSHANSTTDFILTWIKALLADGGGLIATALFLAVWRYGPDDRTFVHLATVSGVLAVFCLSMAMWYRPSGLEPDEAALLPRQNSAPYFAHHIPVNAVVYWEDDPQMAWFVLGRSHYVSKLQTAGIVFSRQTAIEGKRRVDRLAGLGLRDSVFEWNENTKPTKQPNLKGLVHLCQDTALDYVVLTSDLGAGVLEKHARKTASSYFFLYDCAKLRVNH